ncbi:MazG nucleotide pyrophosphohydrolase domain-containing protein [Apilactobacillus quenuiae]|uniref:MazG nucleotide pyrophosphohydrolase domain-containing protein n=1 Tax=Apilactobacillus quenuiae TaxID=2008377 RepID=UPI000D018A7B|nr:MazG-like family protein [Apilactobacillus quenuiae]
MKIDEHLEWLIKFYKQRNWYNYSPFVRMNYLNEEQGELSRAIRTLEVGRDHPSDPKRNPAQKMDNLKEELADNLDQILMLCDMYNIKPEELMKYSENKFKDRFKK